MGIDDKKPRYSYDFDMESFFKTEDVKTKDVKEEKQILHTDAINTETKKANIRDNKSSDITSKRKLILYTSITAGVLIIVAFAIIMGSRSKALKEKTIEFNEDCFNLFMGEYEGIGEVKVTKDYEEIRAVVMEVFEEKDYDEEELEEQFRLFYDEIYISAEVDGELVNGNKVNVSIEVRDKVLDEFDVAIEDTEFTVEITGLESVVEVNPFEYMHVYSTGTTDNGFYSQFFFTYPEEYYGLTADDFVTGFSEYPGEYSISVTSSAIIQLEKQGIVLTEIDYFFDLDEVDGTMVRNFDELYDSIYENLKLNAQATISVMYEDEPEVTLEEIEYYGGWLSVNDYTNRGSELELVYKTTVSHKAGLIEPMTLYAKVTYGNIVDVDGYVEVMGDYAVVDTMPTYVQVGDESYYMGIGIEDYADYLFDIFLSSSAYTVLFDQKGNITQY